MKQIKYLLLLCLICFPFSVSAQKYDITAYYIDVVVNENNTYDISEYYNVMFNEKSNFTRNISLRPKVYLSNSKFITYITKVSGVSTEERITNEIDSKNYKVEFQTPYENMSRTISLSYKYDMGHDLDSKNDIVFINVIDGTFMPLTQEASFAITLPSGVENEDVAFYVNGKKIDSKNVNYTVFDNYVEGTITHDFKDNDTISIQVKLPDGTFKNTHSTENAANYLLLILPIVTLALAILLMKKYKTGKHKVIENYMEIADRFDSLEIAYLHKGHINATDLTSIIFKLANDGYISLKNYGDSEHISLHIIKNKEYDKDNAVQKIVFDGLFQNKDEVVSSDIEGIFYPYYMDAIRTLEHPKNTKRMFYNLVNKFKIGILVSAYLCLFSLQVAPLYNLLDSHVFSIILSLILGAVCASAFQFKNKILKNIVLIISIGIVIMNIYALIDFRTSLIVYIFGTIFTVTALYIETLLSNRTPYGNQMYYETESFKLELATMSDEIFESKMQSNPNYFFDMIPYVIIFELTGWWFNRFASKVQFQPSWYDSSETYTSSKLLEFIESTLYGLSIIIKTNKAYHDELLNQARNKLL